MALDRLDFGTVPNPVAGDWALLSAIVSKAFQNTYSPIQFVSTNILQGATFQIGGVIYYGSSDTAITGTPSNYVKLTPNVGDSGATCDAAFVTNLTGVTWSKIYNGYYDVSGNLHIFDEITAILAGHLSGSNTKFSQLFNAHLGQSLKPTDTVIFSNMTSGSNNNQDVRTTANPTFASLNTGQGANELYDMNQNVKTTNNVTFASLNTDNAALKMKVLSVTDTAQYIWTLPHGVTEANIRGIAPSSSMSSAIDRVTVNGSNIIINTISATTGTMHAVIFYV